jgi:hypothetical protein
VTIGPSDESLTATSNVGMACHIAAASSGTGARRYDPDMTAAMRTSIGNGIWMCYTHGKLIDTDENRFTIPMLQKWRQLAELHTRLSVEGATHEVIDIRDLSELDLAVMSVTLHSPREENLLIGNALRDSCVPILWGETECHAIRDMAIELARNAFAHGGATYFSVEIEQSKIRLIDNGTAFNSLRLNNAKTRTGGVLAVRHLMEEFASTLIITSRRVNGCNETLISFVRKVDDLTNATPCVFGWKIGADDSLERSSNPGYVLNYDVDKLKDCQMVYVVIPDYFVFSDERHVRILVSQLSTEGKQVSLVVSEVSQLVKECLQQIPNTRVIQIPPRRR